MEGFLVLDYMSRVHGGDCRARRPGARGKLKNKVDVQHDLENAPETLRRLFEGRNEGKQLLRESNSSPLHMGWRQRPLSRSRWTRVGPFPYYDFTRHNDHSPPHSSGSLPIRACWWIEPDI
jgi:hypothetical protein